MDTASFDVAPQGFNGIDSMVDPFLVEALQNPRHRLTILRMELDIQKFLHNPDQQHFEFQHFPTSYLRLAAHRVAQHYGLQTMVQDSGVDGFGNRILVRKTAESRLPSVHLSEIPAKQLDNEKHEQVKIVIRPRPNKMSEISANDGGLKQSSVRSVEERKEEYDRARARIFSSPSSPELDDTTSQAPSEGKYVCSNRDETEGCRTLGIDLEKFNGRDAMTSRVAIFKDREKDRSDPDYDRNYDRYIRNLRINQNFSLAPFVMPKIQPPFVQYDSGYSLMGHIPGTQASVSYGPHPSPAVSPFCTVGLNQTSRDASYEQWQSAAMMYAHSYNQLRHSAFQAPFIQQPLSFDYSQNH
ncbi:R3H domain-containing protein 2 [Cucurbita argyrosperma subsp. argyrosperma]